MLSCKQPVVYVTVPTPDVTVTVPTPEVNVNVSDNDSNNPGSGEQNTPGSESPEPDDPVITPVESDHYPVIKYYSYDGSRLIKSVNVELGDNITLDSSSAPCFKGWSLDPECTVVDFNAEATITVEDNITLYECRYFTVNYHLSKSSDPLFSEKLLYNERCGGYSYSHETKSEAFAFWTKETHTPSNIFKNGKIIFNSDTDLFAVNEELTTKGITISGSSDAYYVVPKNSKLIIDQIYSVGSSSGNSDSYIKGAENGVYFDANVGDVINASETIYYRGSSSYNGRTWVLYVKGFLITYTGIYSVKE